MDGLCSDIHFRYNGKKYDVGMYEDDGNSRSNVKYCFGQKEYDTLEEMLARSEIEGTSLKDFDDDVTVTECNGCYPQRWL